MKSLWRTIRYIIAYLVNYRTIRRYSAQNEAGWLLIVSGAPVAVLHDPIGNDPGMTFKVDWRLKNPDIATLNHMIYQTDACAHVVNRLDNSIERLNVVYVVFTGMDEAFVRDFRFSDLFRW